MTTWPVTAAEVRGVMGGSSPPGTARRDPDILVIFDVVTSRPGWPGCCGTSPCRCWAGWARTGRGGRRRRPARRLRACLCGRPRAQALDDAACPGPDVTLRRRPPGTGADARAWHRMDPKLKARGAWAGHQGELPVIEGTLVKLTVGHLPHDRAPKPAGRGPPARTRIPMR